jgi:hypothetical protein
MSDMKVKEWTLEKKNESFYWIHTPYSRRYIIDVDSDSDFCIEDTGRGEAIFFSPYAAALLHEALGKLLYGDDQCPI